MITPNNKISLLVNQQFPDFVQEEYPLFVRFLEAYYEFLENKITLQQFITTQDQTVFKTEKTYTPNTIDVFLDGIKLAPSVEYDSSTGTEIKLITPTSAGQILSIKLRNDLYSRAKEMINIKDVDESLTDFQNEFFNTYLSLFPKNTDASKFVLIKNASELFKSKGNENSFKYFFRTLFNEEIDIITPKNDVLIASGGKWKIPRVLRTTNIVYSEHLGGNTEYYLALPRINFPQDPFDGQNYTLFGEAYEWNNSTGKWTDKSIIPVRDTLSVYVDDVLKNSDFNDINWSLLNKAKSNNSLLINEIDSGIRGIFFKPDGTRLFFTGVSTARLIHVNLTIPWKINSASTTYSYSPRLTRLDPGTVDVNFPSGFEFKPDGTRAYITSYVNNQNRILEYNLTEAWNIASLQVPSVGFFNPIQKRIDAGVTSVGVTQITPTDLKFKSDGTRLFVIQTLNDSIDEYSLSTAWQVNTATYLRSIVPNQLRPSSLPLVLNPQAIIFKDDGSRIFISSGSSNTVYQFNMSESWNIQTSSYVSHFDPKMAFPYYPLLAANTTGSSFFIGGSFISGVPRTDDVIEEFISVPDYSINREDNKLVFATQTDETSNIKVYYDNFDYSLLVNRKIQGSISNASTIIETSLAYPISEKTLFEFDYDQRNLVGTFKGNENYKSSILASDDSLVNLVFEPFSIVSKINIIDGGSSYNVGDPARIIGGQPIISATANVSKVFSGNLNLMNVIYGGAGFTAGFPITGTDVTAAITVVDTSGRYSPNTYTYSDDVIWDLSGVRVSNTNYKQNNAFIFSSLATPNGSSRIIDCARFKTKTELGPISNVIVFSSGVTIDKPIPTLNALSSNVVVNSVSTIALNTPATSKFYNIIDAGSIGRIDILAPGENYQVGNRVSIYYLQEELAKGWGYIAPSVPSPNTLAEDYEPENYADDFSKYTARGFGAYAYVSEVDESGGVRKVDLRPAPPKNYFYTDYSTNGRINITAPLPLTPVTSVGYSDAYGNNFNELIKNTTGTIPAGALLSLHIGWDFANTKFDFNQFLPTLNLTSISSNYNPRGFAASNNGNIIFLLDQNERLFKQYNLDANNDSRTANVLTQKVHPFQTGVLSAYGMKFNANGSRLFICETTSPASIRQYNLTEAWNVNSAILQTFTLPVNLKDNNPRDLSFSEDGKKLVFIGNNRKLFQYSLGVSHNVATISNSVSSIAFSAGATSTANVYLTFTGGGTEYVKANAQVFINRTTNEIQSVVIHNPGEYSLSSPLQVTALTAPTGSATFTVTMDNNQKESSVVDATTPTGLFIHPKGNTIFVANATGQIYHYNMTEAWNVATMESTFKNVKDITNLIANPITSFSNTMSFLSFSDDGNKMYVGSQTGGRVLQFDTTLSSYVDTYTGQFSVENDNRINFISRYGVGRTLRIPNTLIFGYSTNNVRYSIIRGYDPLGIPWTGEGDMIGVPYNQTYININASPVAFFPSLVYYNAGSNNVIGIRTNFRKDFKSGDQIFIKDERKIVSQIISDTLMYMTTNFSKSIDRTYDVGLYNELPLGGINYKQDDLPSAAIDLWPYVQSGRQETVTLSTGQQAIATTFGSGCILRVTSIMSDGENLTMASNKKRGQIEEIEIKNPGTGYSSDPEIFLDNIGDGTAKASLETLRSVVSYPGYFTTSDGFLSGDKKLQDTEYYNTGTYVLRTKQQFEKFKTSILNLIHPSGKRLYAEYAPEERIIESPTINNETIKSNVTLDIV